MANMLPLVDFLLTLITTVLALVAVLGIPAANHGLAASAAWQKAEGSHDLGSVSTPATLLGFCAKVSATGFGSDWDCSLWNDVVSSDVCDNPPNKNVEITCNNKQLGPVLSALVILSFVLLIVKVIIGSIRLCGSENCCMAITPIVMAAIISLTLLIVVIIFGTQCYLGDDVPQVVPGLEIEASYGPGFFCALFAALAMVFDIPLCVIARKPPAGQAMLTEVVEVQGVGK